MSNSQSMVQISGSESVSGNGSQSSRDQYDRQSSNITSLSYNVKMKGVDKNTLIQSSQQPSQSSLVDQRLGKLKKMATSGSNSSLLRQYKQQSANLNSNLSNSQSTGSGNGGGNTGNSNFSNASLNGVNVNVISFSKSRSNSTVNLK